MKSVFHVVLLSVFVSVAMGVYVTDPHTAEATRVLRKRFEKDPDTVTAYINDTMETQGWIAVRIRRSSNGSRLSSDDPLLWYSAGFAEGSQLQQRIWQHWTNTVKPTPNATLAPALVDWISQHLSFIETRVTQYSTTDSFWKYTGLILSQLRGLYDGYMSVAPPAETLSFFDFFVYNFQFELGDVDIAVGAPTPPLKSSSYRFTRGGCTAYVKPVAGGDLYVAHTTWTGYETMIRVFRDVDLGGVAITYSGYPGLIHSGDDYYTLSTGLVVMETTIIIFTTSIYQFVQPNSVSEWIRVMVANHVAIDGNSWTNTFARYNSGTYNNEYMVVDMNLYVAGAHPKDLPNGFLWIVEQLPGMTPTNDVTNFVRANGYWGSYNRAYFDEVYNVSGLRHAGEQFGTYFIHSQSPRAQIMRREDKKVSTLGDVQHLIRFNEWQTDPLAVCPGCENPKGNAFLALAARGDLIAHQPDTNLGQWGPTGFIGPTMPFGSTDAKITSAAMMRRNRESVIVSGPTTQDQPPFQWSTSYVNKMVSHFGQPDLFNFSWTNSSVLLGI